MHVLGYELRKLFHWKKLLIITGICLFIYQLLLSFYLEHFPNGSKVYEFNIAVQMVDDYGLEMDETDFAHFQALYEEKMVVFAERIAEDPRFSEWEVTTFEEYVVHDSHLDAPSGLRNYASYESDGRYTDLMGDLYTHRDLIYWYENARNQDTLWFESLNESQQQRLTEIVDSGVYASILPEQVLDYYRYTQKYAATAILLSIMVLVMPLYIGDRRKRLLDVQYTSKHGRKLFRTKLLAALLGTMMLTTVLMIIYFFLFAQNDISMFLEGNVSSAIAHSYHWVDLTLLQYMGLTIVAVYLMAISLCLLTAGLSRLTLLYPVLIGMLVPLAYASLTAGFYYLLDDMLSLWRSPWSQAVGFGVLVAGSVALVVWLSRREKRLDLQS